MPQHGLSFDFTEEKTSLSHFDTNIILALITFFLEVVDGVNSFREETMNNRMMVTTRTYSQYNKNVQLGSIDHFKDMVLP